MEKLDNGYKESEKALKELEVKLHKEYQQAYQEMKVKADSYFAKFKQEDLTMKAKYEQGEITKKQYTEWRQRKMLTGKRWRAMQETLARDLVNTDKIAMSYVSDKALDIFAFNVNYETYGIEWESKIDTSFTLYNKDAVKVLIKDNPQLLPSYTDPSVDISKDMRWNMQHIQSAVTQGILQGESVNKVAKRLQNVTNMDERAAIRNARTAIGSAQNAGRFEAMKRAEERGLHITKIWVSTLDHVTRDSHVDLDGEERELNEEFSNHLDYPLGAGPPEEVYNCRCKMVRNYSQYKTNWQDMSLRNNKLGDMTYDEWKAAHHDKAVKIRAKQRAKYGK